MPRGIKKAVETVREATDDREDFYAVREGNKINPTRLGWTVAGVIGVLALIGLLVVLF